MGEACIPHRDRARCQPNCPNRDITVEIEVADAGLDQRVGVALVDLEYPIHPLQVEHHAAGKHGSRSAVAEIPARGDRIDRNPVAVSNPDDALHLLDAIWRDSRGSYDFVGFAEKRRIGVAIEGDILVAGENPLFADGLFELLDSLGKIIKAHAGWNVHSGLPFPLGGWMLADILGNRDWLSYARALRMLFGQMPLFPGDRIPFGSSASFTVS